jgi:hypothetical protein
LATIFVECTAVVAGFAAADFASVGFATAGFKADAATDFFLLFFLELETGVAGVVTAARTIPENKTRAVISGTTENRRVCI